MAAPTRPALTLLATAALVAAGLAAAPPSQALARPSEHRSSEHRSDHRPSSTKALARPATLKKVKGGYYYGVWGQNNHVTVTVVEAGLQFRDPKPVRWEGFPKVCHKKRVRHGVKAICPVPRWVSPADPLTLDFEMRLGDDVVDTSTLPAQFQASVLADAGRDVVHTGAGDDFINGAFDHDELWSGDGDDLVNGGESADLVFGEGGKDRLVGGEVGDVLHGGDGNDSVEGGPGDDTLYGDAGSDTIKCGDGHDLAESDPADTRFSCEGVAP
ncbi:calcium-binding protein [Nocardioides sp. MH1]|uniref:calcium-binding protein n=1 Tax=Nocardioides sp. MH1 TaxID=3242490 RepID=UPI00351FD471